MKKKIRQSNLFTITLERLYFVNLFKILNRFIHENTFLQRNTDESPFSFRKIVLD